jgi:hypothetical protein
VDRYKGVDLLWVIDNSGSMADYQDRVIKGIESFAKTYFVAGRDIRIATITTDVYFAGITNNASYGPGMGKCFSRLLPGVHDGVRPAIAELNDDCSVKGSLAGRSGKSILATYTDAGTQADLNQLIADFQVNAKVGTSGGGSERAMQSLGKLLSENEERPECANGTRAKCLFRKNRIRGLVFVGDEHSQDVVTTATETIDLSSGATAKMTDADLLKNAAKLGAAVKARLDGFFTSLDGAGKTDPNYFVTAIANHTCVGTCGLDKNGNRDPDESWGPEYSALVDAVKADGRNSAAGSSNKANINDADYSKILSQIGSAIETQTESVQVTSFTLKAAPTTHGPISAFVVSGGSKTQIASAAIKVSGKTVDIDRSALPATLPADAQIEISYYP